jgi:hypothetical protein
VRSCPRTCGRTLRGGASVGVTTRRGPSHRPRQPSHPAPVHGGFVAHGVTSGLVAVPAVPPCHWITAPHQSHVVRGSPNGLTRIARSASHGSPGVHDRRRRRAALEPGAQ